MQDKNQINCTCMAPFYNASEKLFLARKDKIQELDSTFFGRRMNKNSEVKSQNQNKSHKKSLKKRSGSQLQTEISPVYLYTDETYRNEDEWKNQPQNYDHSHQSIQANRINTIKFKSQITHENLNSTKRPDPFLKSNLNYQVIDSKEMHSSQQYTSKNIYSSTNQAIGSHLSLEKRQSVQISSKHQNYQPLQKPINKNESSLLKTSVENKKERQNLPVNSVPLILKKDSNADIIIGKTLKFKYLESKILQNKQLNNFVFNKNQQDNDVTINQESRANKRPRQIRKQKNLSKLLQVRMAESEEQSIDQSVSSQVIGKCFDRNYQEIDELDETVRFTETLATRSTNTKASELTKVADLNGGVTKDKTIGGNLFQSARFV